MPELPEINRLVDNLHAIALGKCIFGVEISDDPKVFRHASSEQFVSEIKSRTIKGINRRGSLIYLDLDGPGDLPVFEFSKDAMVQVRGHPAMTTYPWKKAPQDYRVWPPLGMKFILDLRSEEDREQVYLAFIDNQRQSQIYLCADPLTVPPISSLGKDPLLDMYPYEHFEEILQRRKTAMKELLTDQTFLAGVGDWLADEILYHAMIHPEERSHRLSQTEKRRVYEKICAICTIAVQKTSWTDYPRDWLFHYRMKGKRPRYKLLLPDNETPASIQFITNGDRVSVYVKELQHQSDVGEEFEYSSTIIRKRKAEDVSDTDPNGGGKRQRTS